MLKSEVYHRSKFILRLPVVAVRRLANPCSLFDIQSPFYRQKNLRQQIVQLDEGALPSIELFFPTAKSELRLANFLLLASTVICFMVSANIN